MKTPAAAALRLLLLLPPIRSTQPTAPIVPAVTTPPIPLLRPLSLTQPPPSHSPHS